MWNDRRQSLHVGGQPGRQQTKLKWYFLSPILHSALVLAGVAFWISNKDANIAAGFGLMWTAGLGLPWSILMFLDQQYYGLSEASIIIILSLCAMLNVALHTVYRVRKFRRDALERALRSQP